MTAPIVVVSRDGQRRRDWSDELARDGQHVIGCAARDCPLLRGERCDVLGQGAAAVYDEDAVLPELFLALVRSPVRPLILFARDAMADGRHHARYTRVLERSRTGDPARPHALIPSRTNGPSPRRERP